VRAYKSDLRHFKEWGGVVPASPAMIAEYLAEHAEVLSIATLQRRLIALSKIHQAGGFVNSAKDELVRATMVGIKRIHGKPQRQVKPITKELLIKLTENIEDSQIGRRDRALLLIGFAGAFRRSELVAINCTDLEFVDQGIVINIEKSKTDQEGKGRRIGIPRGFDRYCPVEGLRKYLKSSGIIEGPVFRSFKSKEKLSEKRLSDRSVANIIKRWVGAIGLDPADYSGHSLRAGFATSASNAGFPRVSIMQQTGHKSTAMMERYVRDGRLFEFNISI
jgi:integrase